PFPDADFFFGAEVDGFGSADDVSGDTRQVPLFYVVLDFDGIKIAIVIERDGDGDENSLKLHGAEEPRFRAGLFVDGLLRTRPALHGRAGVKFLSRGGPKRTCTGPAIRSAPDR